MQLDTELKPGPSGSFDIAVNGKTVWKKETFAFPTEKEVIDARELREILDRHGATGRVEVAVGGNGE